MLRSLIAILFLYVCHIQYGQEEIPLSDHIGSSDGLSSQLCKSIMEDSYGNLWIGLTKEVNKYDGYTVTEFNPLNTFKEEKFFNQFAEDDERRIWMISAMPEGFYSLDIIGIQNRSYNIHIVNPLSNQVIEFHELFPNAPFKLSNVREIYARGNSIFFYTQDQKLYRYQKQFELLLEEIDKENFFGVEDSLHYYHKIDKDQIVYEDFIGNKKDTLDLSSLFEWPWISQEANGGLLITSKDAKVDSFFIWKKNKLHTFEKSAARNDEEYHYVMDVKHNEKQDLLLRDGEINSSLWGLSDEQIEVLKRRNCTDFIVGKSGLLYASTGLGIYIFERKENFISSITDVSNKVYSMRKMLLDEDIVVTVQRDKEYIASPSNKYNTDFIKDEEKSVACIEHYLDPLDSATVYSGGYSFGPFVRKIDFKNEKVDFIDCKYVNPIVGCIRSKTNNNLHVYGGRGMVSYSDQTNSFERGLIWDVSRKNDNIKISNFAINYVLESGSKFWMATNIGILVYDQIKEEFVNFKYQEKFLNARVQYLHIDNFDPNILWVGTSNNGLKKFNYSTGEVESWDKTNGLSNNSIHYIYQDVQNRLWLPTNNLLNCLDVEANRLYKFSEEDGIAHSEFNTFSFYKNEKTGRLYLGGIGGISHFLPDSIYFDQGSGIKTRILTVNSLNKKGQLSSNNIYDFENAQLTMEEEHVSLNFKLGTSQIYNCDENIYSYKLPPFINEWESLKSNELNLARLPYGDHKLHFISNFHNPRLTSSELIVDLNINRPFLKTWFFYGLCFLMLSFLVWFYIRQRTKTIQKRNTLLEDLVEKRTNQLEQANKSKTRIFQILAHDLRGPIASLASLSKMVGFLSSKDRLDDLELVAEETERKVIALNDNLDNLLQWAIIEKGNITNKPIEVNVYDVFVHLIDLYKSQINLKNVRLTKHLKETDKTIVDITIFQTISRNALHNAIKFCKEKGNIVIAFNSEKEQATLKITNDYDPNLKDEMKGNGLGFQISQELAALSNGSVDLNIDTKGYSEFVFTFNTKT